MPNMPAFTAGCTEIFICGSDSHAGIYAYAIGSWTPSWSCALFAMDTVKTPTSFAFGCRLLGTRQSILKEMGFVLFTPQFSSLSRLVKLRHSNYHSLQVSVRKLRDL